MEEIEKKAKNETVFGKMTVVKSHEKRFQVSILFCILYTYILYKDTILLQLNYTKRIAINMARQ